MGTNLARIYQESIKERVVFCELPGTWNSQNLIFQIHHESNVLLPTIIIIWNFR